MKELSIFGCSFKKAGRRYQLPESARLFKDFGGTRWSEIQGLLTASCSCTGLRGLGKEREFMALTSFVLLMLAGRIGLWSEV